MAAVATFVGPADRHVSIPGCLHRQGSVPRDLTISEDANVHDV